MSDAEACLRWVSDPDVSRFLGLLQPARTLEQERAWIANLLTAKGQQLVFVIEDDSGRAIGTCGLRGIDREAGTAFFGIVIGEKGLWNQGYGTAATNALLGHAFGELGLREVRLSCHEDNRGAIRCYEKVGFLPSAHTPDRWQFGRREVRMAITRERWEKIGASREG
jgi:RimJ/RimL family protein N-acetyltransferase